MRYDNFIIWGNGLNYVPSIVSMIRDDSNFEIITMKRFETGDMETFIKDIYACDPYPWEHLVAKTRYLLQSPQEIVFILVKNLNPNEIIKGKGDFEHRECVNVVNLKVKIRNQFNPRWNSNHRILPLDAGVSHAHCIHGSDYEDQTEHVLKVLGLPYLNYYKRNDDKEYYFPYHIDYKTPTLVKKNIDTLKINIIGAGIVSISDTPHFGYVNGDKQIYINYFYNNFGVSLNEDHFPENFDKLIENFDINYKREDGKINRIIINSGGRVLDGAHRLAIMKKQKYEEIECIQI